MTTKRFLYTALVGSMVLLPACSAEKRSTDATSENAAETINQATVVAPTVDAEIPDWVTSKAGPQTDCPPNAGAGTPDNPGFNFNGTTNAPDFHCHQTGPFDWGGKVWYVQRIHSLTTVPESSLPPGAPKVCSDAGLGSPCLFDGTRVCSKQGANSSTPAGTTAGGGGCGVYQASVKLRKKP
jgi:hypothetical protein